MTGAPTIYVGDWTDKDGNVTEVYSCEDVPRDRPVMISEETLQALAWLVIEDARKEDKAK